jgi:hypothetical protein
MNDVNHYNSPTRASAHGDRPTDFRARAVAKSEIILRTRMGSLSPEQCGLSTCLERKPSLAKFRARIKATALGSAILALTGLAGGGIILCLQKAKVFADDPHLQDIAASCWADLKHP